MSWEIVEQPEGLRMELTGPWTAAAGEAFVQRGCSGLLLSYTSGWRGESVEFLSELPPSLRFLSLCDWQLEDVEPVSALGSVEWLIVRTAALNGLDLSGLRWSLRKLTLNGCTKLARFDEVAVLRELEVLALIDCGNLESLAPIRSLSGLRKLFFYGSTKILDGDLSILEEMQLDECAFANRRHYSHRLEDFRSPRS